MASPVPCIMSQNSIVSDP